MVGRKRVEAKEDTVGSDLKEWTVPSIMSIAFWRIDTPELNIWNLYLLARVLLSIFP